MRRRSRPESHSTRANTAYHRLAGTLSAACLGILCLGTLPACAPTPARPLILASTTSTEDSGLFDVLLPAFRAAEPGYDVKVIAVGTGHALTLGRRKDADVLLVHAPRAESTFVARGHGVRRCDVMYNDFVVLGPATDPADVRAATTVATALRRIAAAGAGFISRGDDSGTHRKERDLWAAAGVSPDPAWYVDAGQGMGEVLRIAGERQLYTLSDRATYLFLRDGLGLDIVHEGDPALFNQYGVIPVAGAANRDGARAFTRWITSPAGQRVIGAYGRGRFGMPLFTPNADGC